MARRVVQAYRRIGEGPSRENPYATIDAGALAVQQRQRALAPSLAAPPRLKGSPTIRPEEMGPGQSPGAVFDTADAAARAALEAINIWSIAENTEHHFGVYRSANGKYGYTKPTNEGRTGGRGTRVRAPGAVVGFGHTHGDYSDFAGNKVSKARDAYDSDAFSSIGDAADRKAMRDNDAKLAAYYLGTPSGVFYVWRPGVGRKPL